ncbi:MAG: phosphate ABC transporter permease PstA, partial [Nitrospirales bacterium]
YRTRFRVGNRDVLGTDFKWVREDRIAEDRLPDDLAVLTRREWGPMYGRVAALYRGDQVIAEGPEAWSALGLYLDQTHRLYERIRDLEEHRIGDINYHMERLRLDRQALRLDDVLTTDETARDRELGASLVRLESEYQEAAKELEALYQRAHEHALAVRLSNGQTVHVPLAQILRVMRPNEMAWWNKSLMYLANLWEFVSGEPRESNTEGGIFPAIFGTVLMVFLMTIVVTPFGVLAAVYLREYAKQGPLVKLVRIAVNNLAGVPSIVFGVFGLAFFVYAVGGTIDALWYPEALPNPTYGTGGILWASVTLALLTVPVVIVATEEGLSSVPRDFREGSVALGATKFETIWKVVLPYAMPGILTGLILAMARAAGEVAPLMLVGVVKLAPALPLDGFFPFLHLDRKFMHLGFHIYDVGFQSPNVEAAKPMVYMTTLTLIVVVVSLNLVAVMIRNRLRKRHAGSAV